MSYLKSFKIYTMTNFLRNFLLLILIFSSSSVFAQKSVDQDPIFQNTSMGKAVMAWYSAYEKKDWNMMAQVLTDSFKFSSPNDDHIDLKHFKERCWPNAYSIKRFDLIQFAVHGDHIFVISNGRTTDGKLFRNADYFVVRDGKIMEYECYFGPGVNYPTSGK